MKKTVPGIILMGCCLFMAPVWAGTTAIDFEDSVGLFTDQTGPGTLTAVAGRASFSDENIAYLEEDGERVIATGTITINLELHPYGDATNGVGIILTDTAVPEDSLIVRVDGEGHVLLQDPQLRWVSTGFPYPNATGNVVTLTASTTTGHAGVTMKNTSAHADLGGALALTSHVYVGVFSFGAGAFEDFEASGLGIPDYPSATPPPPPPPPAPAVFRGSPGLLEIGDKAVLSGTVAGMTPPITYRWYKNGSETPVADDARVSGSETATLTIKDLTLSDHNTSYVLEAEDTSKAIYRSDPFILKVYEALPASGHIGLALIAGACSLSGAVMLMRRKRNRH